MAEKSDAQKFLEMVNRRLALVHDRDILHETVEYMHRRYVQFKREEAMLSDRDQRRLAPHVKDRATINKNFYKDIEALAVRAEVEQSERNFAKQRHRIKDLPKTRD